MTVSRHQALLALASRLASTRPRFPSASGGSSPGIWAVIRSQARFMALYALAAQAQICVATVRNIERMAVVEPSFFTVLAMVRVLGASIEDVAT